jgi:putative transposase
MVGIISSSYYRVPSGGKKGNKPSKQSFHNTEGFVSQDVVIASVKKILEHEFIDC